MPSIEHLNNYLLKQRTQPHKNTMKPPPSYKNLEACKVRLELQFMGKKLKKSDWGFCNNLNLFIEISCRWRGDWLIIHQTECQKHNTNPVWDKFKLPLKYGYRDTDEDTIKVEILDLKKHERVEAIGEFYVTVHQLQKGAIDSNIFEVIHPGKKLESSDYKNMNK